MGLLLLCLAIWTTCPPTPPHETTTDAAVTFYSGGSLFKTGVPRSRHGVFEHGAIFDREQRLFVLRRHTFVTMRFSPGEHIFSASFSGKHSAANSQLSLTLEPGKSYFIRAESESSGIFVVEFEKGRLDNVSCEEAHSEVTEAIPLGKKYISNAVVDRLVGDISLPACH